MNVGFIGCGSIAKVMANTINKLKNKEIVLYAVSARDYNKALAFKNEYNAIKAYGSYEELCLDDNVDLVYIATPHSHHYSHIKLALENNKNVLCEKAFTVNSKEASEVIHLARSKKLLLCEAIWTRFMPSRDLINDLIESNIIGNITSLSANLGYDIKNVPRLIDKNLAGGALLDVGVYPINFALMCFGNDIKRIEASAFIGKEDVDYIDNIALYYSNKVAHLHSTMLATTDRNGYLYGEKGFICVENINNPQSIKVYNSNYELIKIVDVPKQVTGYEYQLIECLAALKKGNYETKSMPLTETLYVMKILDEIRRKINLVYPNDMK